MAETGQIKKIYNLETIGITKVLTDLNRVNDQLEKIRQTKKLLNKEKNDVITNAAAVNKYNTELAKQNILEERLAQQKIKSQREAIRLANLQQQQLAKSAKAQQIENGSINAAKKIISDLTKLKNNLNLSTREGQQLNEQYNQTIARQNAFIKQNADVETQRFRNIGNYGTQFKSFIAGIAGGLAALSFQSVISGIRQVFSASIDEAVQAERAQRMLQNTLKNFNKVAYFDKLIADADLLAEKFSYLDNDDIIAAQEKLVLYGKLTSSQLNEVLNVAIDLSARIGVGLPEATEILIKALEGSGKELKKYGINIKDGKDVTERLGIVVEQLGPKVKGSAADFAQSSEGIAASAKQMRKNLEEELGNKLLPFLNKFYQSLTKIFDGISYIVGGANNQVQMRADAINKQQNLVSGNLFTLQVIQEKHNKAVEAGRVSQIDADKHFLKVLNDLEKQKRDALASSPKINALGGDENFEQTAMRKADLDAYLKAKAQFSTTGLPDKKFDDNASLKSQADIDKDAKDAAARQKEIDEKAAADKLERQRITNEAMLNLLDEQQREIMVRTQKYEADMKKMSEGTDADRAIVTKSFYKDISDINEKYTNASLKELDKQLADIEDNDAKKLAEAVKTGQEIDDQKKKNLQIQLETQMDFDAQIAEVEEEARKIKRDKDKKEADDWKKLRMMALNGVLDLTKQFVDAQLDLENQVIDKRFEDAKAYQDSQKLIRLAQAGSKAEEAAIENEFAAKERELERKRNVERQEVARKQLTIEFALASIKAISTSSNIYEGLIKEGIVIGEYLIALNNLNNQKFEQGGQVPTSTGGNITGPSHAQGGVGFNFEAQGGEMAIVNKNSTFDSGTYHVTGTPRQIASAINTIGGGVTFAPGAKTQRFEYGGMLGSNMSAPVFKSYYSNSSDSNTDLVLQSIISTNQRIDNLKVVLDTKGLSKSQKESEKQKTIGQV